MTLIVLALDALDAGLVEEWELDNLKLNNHKQIETFSGDRGQPHTIEVWPSIATGLRPEEHGINRDNASEWSTLLNPFFKIGAKFLSYRMRMKVGSILESFGFVHDYSLSEVDCETFMDGERRAVHNWPCVENSDELKEMWKIFEEEVYTVEELNRLTFGKSAEQFGWAREMLNYNLELAAVHIHALDVLGHSYTTYDEDIGALTNSGEFYEGPGNIDNLKEAYEKVGRFVKEIENNLDEEDDILILSDHGMKNSILDDDDLGKHSFRAFASTTMDKDLPDSVFEYKEWIEDGLIEVHEDEETVNMPKEQLRELGYIE